MAEKFAFTYEQKKRMARQTAEILTEEIGLKGDAITAVELIPDIEAGLISLDEVEKTHGESVSRILHGLDRIQKLYDKNPAVESDFEVFRKEEAKRPALYSVQDEEKHLVRGVILRADYPIYRNDGRGGYYVTFGADVIREAAERYIAAGRANAVDTDHDRPDSSPTKLSNEGMPMISATAVLSNMTL